MEEADTETMFDVCDYLLYAQISGLELKINLDDNDKNLINASKDRKIWKTYLGDSHQIILPTYELF